MTSLALALFVVGWAAWGCIVNIPAWIRLLTEPGSRRAGWVRLGMVLQAIGTGVLLSAIGSAIWVSATLAPIILISINIPATGVVIWAGLIGLAEASFVWTSQLPKDPPVLGLRLSWLTYLVGTTAWGVAVLLWAWGHYVPA